MITPSNLSLYLGRKVKVRNDRGALFSELTGRLRKGKANYWVESPIGFVGFYLDSILEVSDTGGKNPEALIVLRKETQ